MPIAMMPSGVEHNKAWDKNRGGRDQVPIAMMPSGVEHNKAAKPYGHTAYVPIAMMPSGVEHGADEWQSFMVAVCRSR